MNTPILSPEFAALQAEVQKLRVELTMLLVERDELLYRESQMLENLYRYHFGALEIRIFELDWEIRRLKRKVDLIRVYLNHEAAINWGEIESTLGSEFSAFRREFKKRVGEMEKTIAYFNAERMTPAEREEMKRQYRVIMKRLHPDLNPNQPAERLNLFYAAVEAFRLGDVNQIRLIFEVVRLDEETPETPETKLTLEWQKLELLEMNSLVSANIREIKNSFPFTEKELLNDPDRIAQKIAELEEKVSTLQGIAEAWKEKIRELARLR